MREGGKVPLFYLPAVGGGRSGPAATRSKYNLVLAFVEGGAAGELYLQTLSDLNREVLDNDARLMAVVPLPIDGAQALATRLSLPFVLLADEGGATTGRILGEPNRAALCVADRYGIIYFLQCAISADGLPPARTAVDWLDFVQIQCPE